MDLKDNGKNISSTACKTNDPRLCDEKHDPDSVMLHIEVSPKQDK